MWTPLISVVMPVYNGFNGGDFFPQAVESVLAQTYRNFEIVIVNDGSTDGGKTRDFCLAMQQKYPDIIKFVDQPNGGVAAALNAGFHTMRGDIFCWLSHDDLFLPNKLERQVDFFNRLGKPDAMLISDYGLMDPEGNLKVEVKFDHASFVKSPKLPLWRGCVNGCTVFIPRSNMPSSPFPVDKRYTQDYWLWFDLAERFTFFHQPEVLVWYRLHEGQDSRKAGAVAEAEELWRTAVDRSTELRRVQLYGSSWRFYDETHKILAPAYPDVAAHLSERRDTWLRNTLVSVVIPFYNEAHLAIRASQSALSQTHQNVEVVLVDDGSSDNIDDVEVFAKSDPRIRLFRKPNGGPGSARNVGLGHCRGDYIAFLDADDLFMPNKIAHQLEVMGRTGSKISHTSYSVIYPARFSSMAQLHSGRQAGRVYPMLLGQCMIATPTVMMHRSLVDAGFRFPENLHLGEDILAWLSVLMWEELLGIDEPLSIVEWSDTTAAVSLPKSVTGIRSMAAYFREHSVHRMFESEIAKLDVAVAHLEGLRQKYGDVNMDMIQSLFQRQ